MTSGDACPTNSRDLVAAVPRQVFLPDKREGEPLLIMMVSKANIVIFFVFTVSFIIGLLFLIMPFSSDKHDGLEKASKDPIGFFRKEDFKSEPKAHAHDSTTPVRKPRIIKQYAGIVGVLGAFGIMIFVGYALKRRRKKQKNQ
ncbi:MAG: hypothetical protein CV087_21525 [Candidatus Brocadia sp. WS118]|nr:MAG: hypothetical protein CV087_21525 [Candidatus Brocadia sp. WS118]